MVQSPADRPPPFPRPPVAGDEFARRWRLLRRIGRGGRGIVFSAWDSATGREVAVKALRPELAADPGVRAAFATEAEAMVRLLARPCVVRVRSFGEHDGLPFLVCDLMRGGSLADLLRARGDRGNRGDAGRRIAPRSGEYRESIDAAVPRGDVVVPEGPPWSRFALETFRRVARALEQAGAEGWTHGDVKPANVLFESGGADACAGTRLADFGLAFRSGGGNGSKAAPTLPARGTLPYMAPELFGGAAPSASSDAWAFGVALAEALARRHPFADSLDDAPERAGAADWGRVARRGIEAAGALPALPRAVADLVASCLSADPGARPRDFGAVADSLACAIAELGFEPLPAPAGDSRGNDDGGSAAEERADTLAGIAALGFAEGRIAEAEDAVREARELYRAAGSARGLAVVAARDAELAERRGDQAGAERACRECVARADEAGIPALRADARKRLGNARFYARDAESARVLYAEARAIAEAAGDGFLVAQCRFNEGGALLALGDEVAAREAFAEADATAARGGYRKTRGFVAATLARGYARENRYEEAARALSRAIRFAEVSGDRVVAAANRTNLAIMKRRAGRPAEAASLCRTVVAEMRALGDRPGECRALLNLALAAMDLGETDRAAAAAEEGLAVYESLGRPLSLAVAESVRAATRRRAGDVAGARRELEAALPKLREARDAEAAASCLLELAECARESGGADAAIDLAIAEAEAARAGAVLCGAWLAKARRLASAGRASEALDKAERALAVSRRIAKRLTGEARHLVRELRARIESTRSSAEPRGKACLPEACLPEARPPEARPPEARPPEARPPEARPPEARPAEASPAEAGVPAGGKSEAFLPKDGDSP